MILSLAILLFVTVLAGMWARQLADQRGRHVTGWTWATVVFPPIVLILWALPKRNLASNA